MNVRLQPGAVASEIPAPTAPRGKILVMSVVAGAVVTNIYCNQPILPLIAAGLGVTDTMADLVAGGALLGFATGLFLLLPLGDRFDRRVLVLVQVALAAIFALAAALSPNLYTLAVASYLLGIASCVPQQLVPFAAALSPPNERGRSVGTVVSGIMIGILVGRTVAGAVGTTLGWRAVYGLEAAMMIPIWITIAMMLPKGKPTTDLSYGKLLASLWPLARDNRPIREAMFVQSLLWACFNAFWVNLATLLKGGTLQLDSTWAGAFGLIGAVGAFAASAGGRAVDRMGPRKVIGVGVVLVAASYVVLYGASQSLALLIIAAIVLDAGVQSGLTSNQTRAFAVDPKAQGRINTLYMTFTFLGGGFGAVVSGNLMGRFGWSGVAVFGVVLALVALAFHLLASLRAASSQPL